MESRGGTVAAPPAVNYIEWDHTVSGENRCLVVGLSWRSLQTATVSSVKYGAADMTLLKEATGDPLVRAYVLRSPPVGTAKVRISFTRTSSVNVTAGAVSLMNVETGRDPMGVVLATGSSANPQLASLNSGEFGMLVDVVSAGALNDSESLTPTESDQTLKWYQLKSTAPRAVAASSTRPVPLPGSLSQPALGWLIKKQVTPTSRPWVLVAVPLRPAVVVAGFDVVGGAVPTPAWINAADYADLQEAIDALPATGGVIYLPVGNYLVSGGGVTISKPNVTLLGESRSGTTIFGTSQLTDDVVTVTSEWCSIKRLRIVRGSPGQGILPRSCLRLQGESVANCRLEDLLLSNAPEHGLFIQDISSLIAVAVACDQNTTNGAKIERTAANTKPWAIQFVDCAFTSNDSKGLEISSLAVNNVDSIVLLGCFFEGSSATGPGVGTYLQATNISGLAIIAGYFEHRSPNAEPPVPPIDQMVAASGCPGIAFDGCYFNGYSLDPKATRAILLIDCSWARVANGLGFQLIDEFLRIQGTAPGLPESAVEFANREILNFVNQAARVVIDQGSVFSLSQGGVGVPRRTAPPSGPASVLRNGAMYWDDSTESLRVLVNSTWMKVNLTGPF